MAKLSDIAKRIGMYLELHGDKDVESIATWHGSDELQFTFHLYDIYEGPCGSNPFTGKDHLDIPKNNTKADVRIELLWPPFGKIRTKGYPSENGHWSVYLPYDNHYHLVDEKLVTVIGEPKQFDQGYEIIETYLCGDTDIVIGYCKKPEHYNQGYTINRKDYHWGSKCKTVEEARDKAMERLHPRLYIKDTLDEESNIEK